MEPFSWKGLCGPFLCGYFLLQYVKEYVAVSIKLLLENLLMYSNAYWFINIAIFYY